MEIDRWYPTLTALPNGQVLISGGDSRDAAGRNSFELYDPTATPGNPNGTVTRLPVDFMWGDMPTYPFLFVLPNGDVLYAGGEGADDSERRGRILIPDYSDPQGWAWDEEEFNSATNGGSAVMFAPGRVLKSGGTIAGGFAVTTTETLDLRGFESGEYATASEFTLARSMSLPRHFHTLTILPDGRVLATGGNEKGNGRSEHDFDNPCDYPEGSGQQIKDMECTEDRDCPAVPSKCVSGGCPALGGAACTDSSECATPCTVTGDCPLGATCEAGRCLLDSVAAAGVCDGGRCDPYRNECYATRAAEIWDPGCDEWIVLGEQDRARMYHSTALLVPDGRVISMGSGHRQLVTEEPNAEYFEPDYGTGDKPRISIALPAAQDVVSTSYGQEFDVTIENPGDVEPREVVLLRLGTVTHQFDMDQRRVPLDADWETPWTAEMPLLRVRAPTQPSVAPPGYYMLFVISSTGEPSLGAYLRLSQGFAKMWACPATPSLAASESSCAAEPIAGKCPGGSEVQTPLALPVVAGASGPVDGWQVVTAPGEVVDPATPTTSELAAVHALCVSACQSEWGDPAVAANCDHAGVFGAPQPIAGEAIAALDMVPSSFEKGGGIFPGQSLGCVLGSTCFSAFDEASKRTVPERVTPGPAVVKSAEEYRVALGGASEVEIITSLGTTSGALTGSVGYAGCRDGNASEPCPFYLGSLDAQLASSVSTTLECDDASQMTLRLDDLTFELGQPAFGIAEANGSGRGFPPGALVVDATITVDGVPYTTRRPNAGTVLATVVGRTFSASNVDVALRVPCNESEAHLVARVRLESPSNGGTLARPPAVTITTPDQVLCTGGPIALSTNASDEDDDLVGVRWRVDGVPLAPGRTSMPFTGPHTLEAIAEDARGARTTAKKEVTCAPI